MTDEETSVYSSWAIDAAANEMQSMINKFLWPHHRAFLDRLNTLSESCGDAEALEARLHLLGRYIDIFKTCIEDYEEGPKKLKKVIENRGRGDQDARAKAEAIIVPSWNEP